MKNFKLKNFFWVAFWVVLAVVGGDKGRAPALDLWLEEYRGWQWNLLGFSPFILSGLYNYFFINEKPYKKDAQRAFRLALLAFIYFMLMDFALGWRGYYQVVLFSVWPWGMFLVNSVKYLKGFLPK